MTPAQLENFASLPRFNRYLTACNDPEDAVRLYGVNLSTSKAFYPLLSLFETFLRNRINAELTAHFSDADWIITQRQTGGFMNRVFRCYMKYKVGGTIQSLQNNGVTVSAGKIISEQTLGFWTLFFEPRYYGFVGGRVIRCFPHRPRQTIRRIDIYNRLERIRELRNRVYHNEPICFDGSNVSFNQVRQVHQDISELFAWIDPLASHYAQSFDDVIDAVDAY